MRPVFLSDSAQNSEDIRELYENKPEFLFALNSFAFFSGLSSSPFLCVLNSVFIQTDHGFFLFVTDRLFLSSDSFFVPDGPYTLSGDELGLLDVNVVLDEVFRLFRPLLDYAVSIKLEVIRIVNEMGGFDVVGLFPLSAKLDEHCEF